MGVKIFFRRFCAVSVFSFFLLARARGAIAAWGNVQEEYANETVTSGLIATVAVALVLFFIWWDKRSRK